MKRTWTTLIAAAALATAGSAHATGADAGTVASNIFSIQTAARPAAMANAFSAVADDINSLYRNPAGLGYLRKSEGLASRFSGLGQLDANTIAVAIPLGDVTTSNVHHLGVVGVSVANMNYGRSDLTDASGNRIGSFDAKDQVLTVGWGKSFENQLSIGGAAKLYRLAISSQKNSGTLIDLGAVYKAVPNTLNLAVSGQNLGNSFSYEGAPSDSQATVTAGAALMPMGNDRLTLTLDIDKPRDVSSSVKAGVEWLPANALALRAGYDTAYDAGPGLSLGAGIVLMNLEVGFFPVDRVTLDYAYTPGSDLDYNNRIALSCRIGTQ